VSTPEWNPPAGWTRIESIDLHTAGEPLRVITGGWPDIPGATILERRRHARKHHDALRRTVMWEPRGHADMYGCLLLPPASDDGDAGVLFMHNEGWSTMCGHGIIGLVKLGAEMGLLPGRRTGPDTVESRIDTPAGRVTATAHLAPEDSCEPGVGGGRRVERVSFLNVPSFVLESGVEVDTPGVGVVKLDIAFGGAFYAYVEAEPLALSLDPESVAQIIDVGMRIKRAVSASIRLQHPSSDPELEFLYGTIFTGPALGKADLREVCIFADGEVDRSPTGTGVSGLAAILHARGELPLGRSIEVESILGTTFSVRVARELKMDGRRSIEPEVGGTAHVTGRHEFWIDPLDPLRDGFLLGRGSTS
jgi:trans-L-3-hydroxyproline dehydratase